MSRAFFQALLAIVLLQGCDVKPPAHVTDPGHLTYLGFTNREVQCSRCHGDEGQGGMFGPKLRGVVQKHGRGYVRKTILDGKGKGDDSMPAFKDQLTEEQIDQVIKFLATWHDTARVKSPSDSSAATE